MRPRAIGRAGRVRRVQFLLGFWLLALLVLVCSEPVLRRAFAQRPPQVSAHAPNILILIGDDHAGGTLGIDGDPRRATPSLDRLAQTGVRFDRAYCNAPVCTASRQSFITGRLPHAVGVTQLGTPLPEDAITLGTWLRERGYETAAYGKMHFNSRLHHGFADRIDLPDWEKNLKAHPPRGGDGRQPWRPLKDPSAVWLNAGCQPVDLPAESMDSTFFADRAIDFLGRRRERPFLLAVGFYDPHSPFKFPREWQDRYRPEHFPVPAITETDRREQPLVFAPLGPKQVQGIQAAYFTAISFVDHQVGRILDALDASGQAENTIVVYLGDNGYLLGQHGRFEKHCFYEQAVRVPLIVRWPKQLATGRQVASMVELVDVMPTLLDLLGIEAPSGLQGRSLAPLLRGEEGSTGRDVVFSEYLENEEAMVRSDRYKLIVGTGARLRRDGYRTGRPLSGPYERLYDMVSDPDETTDVSARPELVGIRSRLRTEMYRRLITTRGGLERLPKNLTEIDAIHWCLVPRDRRFP